MADTMVRPRRARRWVALALLALACWVGLAWLGLDDTLARWHQRAGDRVREIADAAPAATAVRKCRRGQELVYTNGDCPRGYRSETPSQGTVNVVPAFEVAPPAGARPPTPLEALAGPSLGQAMRDRAIDKAVQP